MKEAEIGRFLRLLAHDLQNQLGAIDLNLQILPTLVDDEDPTVKTLSPFLTRASLASQDMIDTLGDVQSFARSVSRADEGSTDPVEIVRCDLCAKVRDLSMIIASVAKERSITVKTLLSGEVFALGESDSIRRSVKILANEALRASFPGSTLEFRVSPTPVPMIEIFTSQDGVFEDTRPMLSVFFVRQLLQESQVRLLFTGNSIQMLFTPG